MNNEDKNTEISNLVKKIAPPKSGTRLLLHACCAPCTLKPYQFLHDAGWDITVFYSNSNIFPKAEYNKRYAELVKWCKQNNASLINDTYNLHLWEAKVGILEEAPQNSKKRIARCGQCYKLRLDCAAKYAVEHGFKYISTTLAVSPYQYTDEIKKQLLAVASDYKLKAVFADFRPLYSQACILSKELGMYRQKYCGCEFSLRESIEQQNELAKKKMQKAEISKQKLYAERARKQQRLAYQARKRKQKQLLKEFKMKNTNNS